MGFGEWVACPRVPAGGGEGPAGPSTVPILAGGVPGTAAAPELPAGLHAALHQRALLAGPAGPGPRAVRLERPQPRLPQPPAPVRGGHQGPGQGPGRAQGCWPGTESSPLPHCRISSTGTWRPKKRGSTSCTVRGTSCWPQSIPGGTPLRCVPGGAPPWAGLRVASAQRPWRRRSCDRVLVRPPSVLSLSCCLTASASHLSYHVPPPALGFRSQCHLLPWQMTITLVALSYRNPQAHSPGGQAAGTQA